VKKPANFWKRLELLERVIKPPAPEVRVIFGFRDSQGRLTKMVDSHPHLPDGRIYSRDRTRQITTLDIAQEDNQSDIHVQKSADGIKS
jgi:hypothetical protein